MHRKLRGAINPNNVEDVNAYKNRFDDSFLTFCQNKINTDKYENQDNSLPDDRRLLSDYISSEKRKRWLYNVRWISIFIAALGYLSPLIDFLKKYYPKIQISFHGWYLLVASALLLIFIIAQIKKPKAFCTFEKIDLEAILNENK